MNSTELFNFLYDWIDKVLNTDLGLNVPIIQSNQNAPRLKTQHIIIDYVPNRSKTGRATRTDPAPAPDDPDDADEMEEGKILIIEDYVFTLDLREENGSGDYLKHIIDSIERFSIQKYFFDNKVAYLENGNIIPVPRLNNEEWIKQSVVEIRLGLSTFIETMEDSWIETVDYTAIIT